MLSVMQQIGCGLQICFDYRLNFDECFVVSSSAHALFEKRKEEAFHQQRHLRLVNGRNFTVCTNICAVA